MKSFVDFKQRRAALFEKMLDNSVALLSAAPIQYRNGDTERPFRQDSHFYYLTGFNESNAIAALVKTQGCCSFILFCEEKDPALEQWTGSRVGMEGACQIYGADEAHAIKDASSELIHILSTVDTVYSLINTSPHFDAQILSWIKVLQKKVRSGTRRPHQLIDLQVILNEMRLIKTEHEILNIKKACDISAHGHIQAMQQVQVGQFEYHLEAILLYEFVRHGSLHCAYPSIVAAGNHGCTLHYTRNNGPLEDKKLVLIDAGAEVDYYASDITRTFPINGKFTAAQQAIYELVLDAQKSAIKLVKPDLSWEKLQEKIVEILVRGLVDLKILRGNVQDLIHEKAYLPFYMHSSGHWLGLDVHDAGDYKIDNTWRPLKSGMVLTIEPGLYIDEKNTDVDEKWRGIGIRIEDDILVTAQGSENLTQKIPKEIQDIEELMSKSRKANS